MCETLQTWQIFKINNLEVNQVIPNLIRLFNYLRAVSQEAVDTSTYHLPTL